MKSAYGVYELELKADESYSIRNRQSKAIGTNVSVMIPKGYIIQLIQHKALNDLLFSISPNPEIDDNNMLHVVVSNIDNEVSDSSYYDYAWIEEGTPIAKAVLIQTEPFDMIHKEDQPTTMQKRRSV